MSTTCRFLTREEATILHSLGVVIEVSTAMGEEFISKTLYPHQGIAPVLMSGATVAWNTYWVWEEG